MSLSNEVVNIYSDYVIQPNTFTTYIIPSTGVTSAINITLPKIYDNTLEVASFRITNNSTYNAIIKYIANAVDDCCWNFNNISYYIRWFKSTRYY